jgi:Fe-S oxidoreductase
VGYVDSPILSEPTLEQRLKHKGVNAFDFHELKAMSQEERNKVVLVVQDPFTSYYEANLVEDLVSLARKLNLNPVVLPFKPNGKPQHVKGFLEEFANTAKTAADFLNQLHQLDIPMVGVDPSLVLCYRDEYKTILGQGRGDFEVLLVHEWLTKVENKPQLRRSKEYVLFAHCTEKTMLPQSENHWQQLFADFGLTMKVESVGCCGMAGTFGHEAKHLDESVRLFEMSWQQPLSQYKPSQVLATGYSCRSQVARLAQFKPRHPLQVLLKHME